MSSFIKKIFESKKNNQFAPVTNAKIQCIKPLSFSDDIALFVTHCPYQTLKKHVVFYINSLIKQNIPVVLIIATNHEYISFPEHFLASLNGCFIRQNQGFDFAAWAHVLRLFPKLYQSKTLYLINDSVLGPLNQDDFANMIDKIKQSKADFIGLTQNFQEYENTEHKEMFPLHFQSYFLAFKSKALSADIVQNFFTNIVFHSDKQNLTTQYDLQLTKTITKNNLKTEIIFPLSLNHLSIPTASHWKELIKIGFPFIKIENICDKNPLEIDNRHWKETLINKGFDLKQIDFTQLSYFKTQTEKKHCIYQIYYKQDQIPELDHAFIPLDNSNANYPFVFEYNVFKKIYEEELHKKHELIGAFSWKFLQKTKTPGANFLKYLQDNPGYDVYFINPSKFENKDFQNIWTNGEKWHPGIISLTQQILNNLNYNIDLLKINYSMSKLGYSNFWVGNQTFWDKYMKFTLPIYEHCLFEDIILNKKVFEKTAEGHPYYPYIFERLFTLLLTIDPSIKAYKIPST